MMPAVLDKWIEGSTPGDEVQAIARRTLEARLAAVLHLLPLAALRAGEDVEYVHRLRVFTRRALASLRLYADLLPRRRAKWLKKQLRRIRRGVNDARDYDVLAQRWAQGHPHQGQRRLLDHVWAQRAQAQRRIIDLHGQLTRGQRLARRIDQLLLRVRPRGKHKTQLKELSFGPWAHDRLRSVVEKFFRAAPGEGRDGTALHRFRIRGKVLRYTMELVRGAFPLELREKLYPVIETLQDRLGEINDHVTAMARLRQRLQNVQDDGQKQHLLQLLVEERTSFARSRQAFFQWWARQQANLRAGFQQLLTEPTSQQVESFR
jgi:CHAD domain-containing protein